MVQTFGDVELGSLTLLGKALTQVGTFAVPVYTWVSDDDTGLYQISSGDDTIAFTTGGTAAGHFDANQNLWVTNDLIAGGSVQGATFEADSLETVGDVTVGGNLVVGGTGEFVTRLVAPAGTFTAPGIMFVDQTGTGLEMQTVSGSNHPIRTICDGQVVWTCSVNGMTFGKACSFRNNGTAAAPQVRWQPDPDTGMYQLVNGDNTFAFTTGGVAAGHFDADQNLWVTNNLIAGGSVIGATFEADDLRVDAAGTLTAPTGWHQLHWDVEKDASGLSWANKPATLTPFRAQGDHDWNKIDLTHFTEFRIVLLVISTATPSGSKVGLQYSTDGGSNWNGLDNGTASTISAVTAADNVTGLIVTSWTSLHSGAIADVVLRCVGQDGDGASTVTYGQTQVQFRS